MDQQQAERAAIDALRDLVGIFIWYPADQTEPEDPVGPVTQIDLGETPIGDDGLAHLRHFRKLEWLCLEDTEITDAGLVHLETLHNLRLLELAKTGVTEEGILRLKQALPQCQIRH